MNTGSLAILAAIRSADIAPKLLRRDEARRIAANIAKLPVFISIKVEVALAMAARIILAVTSMIGPSLASGSPTCMTESEARTKFPKAQLVWVGTDHCWAFGAVPVICR